MDIRSWVAERYLVLLPIWRVPINGLAALMNVLHKELYDRASRHYGSFYDLPSNLISSGPLAQVLQHS